MFIVCVFEWVEEGLCEGVLVVVVIVGSVVVVMVVVLVSSMLWWWVDEMVLVCLGCMWIFEVCGGEVVWDGGLVVVGCGYFVW